WLTLRLAGGLWGMVVNRRAGPPWAGQRHMTGEDRRNREDWDGGERGRLGPDDRCACGAARPGPATGAGPPARGRLPAGHGAVGAGLLSLLSFMFLIFGLLLLWTAVRLFRHRDEAPDVGNNALVRVSRRILPVSDTYAGGRLISRAGGRRVVTPLFIVAIAIG